MTEREAVLEDTMAALGEAVTRKQLADALIGVIRNAEPFRTNDPVAARKLLVAVDLLTRLVEEGVINEWGRVFLWQAQLKAIAELTITAQWASQSVLGSSVSLSFGVSTNSPLIPNASWVAGTWVTP